MPYFIVFTGRKWENQLSGRRGITWEVGGVWQADSEENACLKAAQDRGVGTCVAIEGFAWGVDTLDAGSVSELGVPLDPIARLERMGRDLSDRIAAALPAPAQRELNRGDNDGE